MDPPTYPFEETSFMNGPLAEIPSFQKFFITAQTAKMADFIFQNRAYRATVYRTGDFSHTFDSKVW